MYSNPALATDNVLDGDDEADRKTVEWLKQQMERREQKQALAAS